MLTRAWLTSSSSSKIISIALAGALLTLSSCDFISNKILTKPIVKIENVQLSAQDFSQELATKLKNLDALSAKDPQTLAVFKNQIVNDFVISTFIDFWFEENKQTITKEELDKEVKYFVSSYPSDAAFREALAEAGLSYAAWIKKVESGLRKRRLFEHLSIGADPVTEEELQSYYTNHRTQYEQRESVLLAHILVADENQADIVKKLLRNQSFTEVAKKYSTAYTNESEDIYGWVEKDSAPELERVFKYRTGEVSGSIKMSEGIHIFKLLQRRAFRLRSFEESRAEVQAEVMALRETARFTAWLDGQIKRYQVKKNLNMLESIRVETQ